MLIWFEKKNLQQILLQLIILNKRICLRCANAQNVGHKCFFFGTFGKREYFFMHITYSYIDVACVSHCKCESRILKYCNFIRAHWENYISLYILSYPFHIEWDMIVVTVLLSILTQMKFHSVQNRKENCHHDHIPFNVKGNENIVFSV